MNAAVQPTPTDVPRDERRRNLRRLDDILEALERLNLNEQKQVPQWLLSQLRDLGIEARSDSSIGHLIERVWDLQRPFLVHLKVERRRSPRRQVPAGYTVDAVLNSAVSRLRQHL